MAENIYFYRKH